MTCRPAADWSAVIVTIARPPSPSVPPAGLTPTEPFPGDTVTRHVTEPPCALSQIVAPQGGTRSGPPGGNTRSVPGGGLGLGDGGGLGDGTGIGSGDGVDSRYGWYYAKLAAQIEDVYRKNKRLSIASTRVEIRVWADHAGRISRVELVKSTGDPELDRVIQSVVGLKLKEPPPSDIPMPMLARITARRAGSG